MTKMADKIKYRMENLQNELDGWFENLTHKQEKLIAKMVESELLNKLNSYE